MNEQEIKAFPITGGNQVYSTGMELRDWFAGLVLNGLLSQGVEKAIQQCEASGLAFKDLKACDAIAKLSYIMADSMMKERR